jgi:hypothetical protein
MTVSIHFIFITSTLWVLCKADLEPLVPSEDYSNKLEVLRSNPNKYLIFWKLIDEDEIQFEIHVKTLGWIGLGITNHFYSAMNGADIVMGWVKDDIPVLKV